MKTVGLMVCLTRALWSSGKALVMNSGLCVLIGILKIEKEGDLWKCIDKKRCYWTRGVNGYGIDK